MTQYYVNASQLFMSTKLYWLRDYYNLLMLPLRMLVMQLLQRLSFWWTSDRQAWNSSSGLIESCYNAVTQWQFNKTWSFFHTYTCSIKSLLYSELTWCKGQTLHAVLQLEQVFLMMVTYIHRLNLPTLLIGASIRLDNMLRWCLISAAYKDVLV